MVDMPDIPEKLDKVVEWAKDNPTILWVGAGGIGLFALYSIVRGRATTATPAQQILGGNGSGGFTSVLNNLIPTPKPKPGPGPGSEDSTVTTLNCPPGFLDDSNGNCIRDISRDCGAGFHMEHGRCTPNLDHHCANGYHLVGDRCLPDGNCNDHQHLVDGQCVDDPTPPIGDTCPAGYHRNIDNVCVPYGPVTCENGYHDDGNGHCVPNTGLVNRDANNPVDRPVTPASIQSALGKSWGIPMIQENEISWAQAQNEMSFY